MTRAEELEEIEKVGELQMALFKKLFGYDAGDIVAFSKEHDQFYEIGETLLECRNQALDDHSNEALEEAGSFIDRKAQDFEEVLSKYKTIRTRDMVIGLKAYAEAIRNLKKEIKG